MFLRARPKGSQHMTLMQWIKPTLLTTFKAKVKEGRTIRKLIKRKTENSRTALV